MSTSSSDTLEEVRDEGYIPQRNGTFAAEPGSACRYLVSRQSRVEGHPGGHIDLKPAGGLLSKHRYSRFILTSKPQVFPDPVRLVAASPKASDNSPVAPQR
jgi:hypothetical protein